LTVNTTLLFLIDNIEQYFFIAMALTLFYCTNDAFFVCY